MQGALDDADRFLQRDRPVLLCLADGIANRVRRLRSYGNAIVASQAVEFIRAYLNEI